MKRMRDQASGPTGSERIFKTFSALSFNENAVTGESQPALGGSEPRLTPESVRDFNVHQDGSADSKLPQLKPSGSQGAVHSRARFSLDDSPVLFPRHAALADDRQIEVYSEFGRLLVPVDFAPAALRALHYAGGIAQRFGSTIYLLHVIRTSSFAISDAASMPMTAEEESARDAIEQLSQLATEELPDVPVRTLVRRGVPAPEIRRTAVMVEADLIILADRRRSALSRFLSRGTVKQLERNAPCALLIIPSDDDLGAETALWRTTMKQFKRIVVMVLGGTVLGIGIVLVVLPGPAFIVIPLGLAILAVEFAWARRWLRKARGLFLRNNEAAEQKEGAG